MRKLTHSHQFITLLLFLIFSLGSSSMSWAQPKKGKPQPVIELSPEEAQHLQDSLDLIIRNRRNGLIEEDTRIVEKVVVELNKTRFNTMARKWWDMPTETAQEKIDKGRYGRYQKPVGIEKALKQPGKVHRHREEVLNKQNVVVWGWHPVWAGEAYRTYNFDLLTHVSFYAYELNPFTGGYRDFEAIYEYKYSDIIPIAHNDTCKVLLSLACHKPECSEIFFNGPKKVRQNLIDSLIAILTYAGGDGIEINFEELPYEFKTDFQDFIRELSFQLREYDPNYTIAMTLPLYDREQVYNIGFLQNWVDLFIISGFNFHLRPTGVAKGPVTPYYKGDASVRGSYMVYTQTTNLDSVLRSPGTIRAINLLHDEKYMLKLLDTLNTYIKFAKIEDLAYNRYDMGQVLNIIKMYPQLLNNPNVRRTLRATTCVVELYKYYEPQEKVQFYLFSPEWDTITINELDVFNKMGGINPKADTVPDDISKAVDRYVRAIGSAHSTSLVLGLPYYGSVWQTRGKSEFKGYVSYAQIRNMIREGKATVKYDKMRNTMIATVSDTIGPYEEIFFDNSTSLNLKIDMALDRKLGGVAIWALSYDHGYNELWEVLEQQFALRTMWNPTSERYERFKIAKSNKIHYTVTYQMKRSSNLIFATLVFMTIFMTIGFMFSLLDWRIRDVMFYSGAFRLFYLTIFTVLILVVGSYFGLFQNRMAAFLVGIILGGILTWVATLMVVRRHEKLP